MDDMFDAGLGDLIENLRPEMCTVELSYIFELHKTDHQYLIVIIVNACVIK